MKVITAEQGTEAWLVARLGIPTASKADALLTPKQRKLSEKRATYMGTLLAEWALGREVMHDNGSGGFMGRGTKEEAEALAWIEFEQGFDIERVGFCTLDDGSFGWSLDGYVRAQNRNVETKVPGPAQHMLNLLNPDEFVAGHFGQVQCGMMGNGAAACFLVSYHASLPKVVRVVHRDEEYIAQFRQALSTFTGELRAAKARLEALGCSPPPAILEQEALEPDALEVF